MKKSDLENGMIVQYREGILRMVIEECLVGLDGHNTLESYDEDLISEGKFSQLDIVRVFVPKEYDNSNLNTMDSYFELENLDLIWERSGTQESFKKWEKVQVRDHDYDEWVNAYFMKVSQESVYCYLVTHNDKFTFTEDSVIGYRQIRKMEEK
ncbi:hypothetical protein P5F12_13290 [Clostridium perfringens]|nr:hypothetical protein [Clostridium perfringens]